MGAPIDTDTNSIIKFQHVFESYEGRPSLKDVTFNLRPGELVALVGPQESGKTTVLRLLLGLARPNAGDITLFDFPPNDVNARRNVGTVLARTGFPATLKLGEVIDLVRAHYPDPTPVDEFAERCGFDGRLDETIGDLSSGDERWLAIMLAYTGNPRAVIMDMPTLGMDVGWRREFWNEIRGFTDGGGLALVTTDVLHEAETYATRVLILHKGELVANGSVDEIIAQHGDRKLHMRADSLPDLDGVDGVEWHDGGPTLHTSDTDAVVRQLAKRDVSFADLEVRRSNLEEVVLALIREDE